MIIIRHTGEWRLSPINDDSMHTQPSSIVASVKPGQRTFPLNIPPTDFYTMAIRKY
mgnify:CR=1 FL=1|jgi:hypothetical protein